MTDHVAVLRVMRTRLREQMERLVRQTEYSDGPVWQAFGLTYASYAVFPRRALQSMPADWQERFVAMVDEMHAALPEGTLSGDYSVQLKVDGKFAPDPLRDYRHTGPLPCRIVPEGGGDAK